MRYFKIFSIIFILSHITAFGDDLSKIISEQTRLYGRKTDAGYVYRGGIGAPVIKPPSKIDFIDTGFKLDTSPNACGGFDFKASFKNLFNKHAASQWLGDVNNLAKGLIGAAPMLILQTLDPQLAEMLKHFKAMANLNLQTEVGQCQEVFNAVSMIGRKMFMKGKRDCYIDSMKEGLSMDESLSHCWKVNKVPEYMGKKYGTPGNYNITEGLFKDLPSDQLKVLKGVLGDVKVNAKTGMATTSKHNRAKVVKDSISKEVAEYAYDMNLIINDFVKGNRTKIDDTYLKKLSIAGVPMISEFMYELATTGDYTTRQHYVMRLSNLIGFYKARERHMKAKAELQKVANTVPVKQATESGLLPPVSSKSPQEEMKESYQDELDKRVFQERVKKEFMEIWDELRITKRERTIQSKEISNSKRETSTRTYSGWGSITSQEEIDEKRGSFNFIQKAGFQ